MADQPAMIDEQVTSDAQLIERFCEKADEQAFALLVRRYQKMVGGVCRRHLADEQDVEDAIQATFIVLAKKAAGLRNRSLLANWLYGVALRVARRAARNRYRRRETALESPLPSEETPFDHLTQRHDIRILDEEMDQLPHRLKLPLVLYHLNGCSIRDIATQMRLSISAVEGRLRRGRKELGRRLIRRGVAPLILVAVTASLKSAEASMSEVTVATIAAAARQAQLEAKSTESLNELAREELAEMSSIGIKSIGIASTAALILAIGGIATIPMTHGQDTGRNENVVNLQEADAASSDANPFSASRQASTAPETVNEPEANTGAESGRIKRIESIEKTLRETVTFNFFEEPLEDAVRFMNERYDARIRLDHANLESFGISPDTPVTLGVTDTSLKETLRLMLRDYELGYMIEGEHLMITTKDIAEAHERIKVYQPSSFADVDALQLLDLIKNMVEPSGWTESGGQGTGSVVNNCIVIRGNQKLHDSVEDFLAQLKDAGILDSGSITVEFGIDNRYSAPAPGGGSSRQ